MHLNVDLRMKNLEQLHYIKQLLDDDILTEKEYTQQKERIFSHLHAIETLNY